MLCYSHFNTDIAIVGKKGSPKTFGVKTKRPPKFFNEGKATSCHRTFDRTHKGS